MEHSVEYYLSVCRSLLEGHPHSFVVTCYALVYVVLCLAALLTRKRV